MTDTDRPTGPMDAETFRREAHRAVDWIADYLGGGNRELPVLPDVRPGDLARRLPPGAPEAPEPPEAIWDDFVAQVLPSVTHWNHPGFMAYFGITGSAPGVLGEMLTAALNVNGMLWRTCPAATELEMVTLNWLRRLLGLPAGFFGHLTDTASISSMLALIAAREAAGLEVRQRGMAGRDDLPPLAVYASDQAHSSIAKGCVAVGIGLDGYRPIAHDGDYRMDVDALRSAIADDVKRGIRPLAVVATVGTTSTTSVDPVPAIAEVCAEHGLWLHVDAAYAGSAAICPEHRSALDGCERSDSFVVNPHKWLFTPIDCSALYTRHPQIFRRAFSLVPEYLVTPHTGAAIDLMDYGVQLGRRFRALKLWWVIRSFGVEGLQTAIRRHVALAEELAAWVDDHPRFERLAPAPFSVVCFRPRPDGVDDPETLDRIAMALMERVNARGTTYLSHTRLDAGVALRVAIGNLATTADDVAACRDALEEELPAAVAEATSG